MAGATVVAGLSPVYPTPSLIRCSRTTVSKKYMSAISRTSALVSRTFVVRSKAALTSASSSAVTHLSTGSTLPDSRAFLASCTTGPFIVSQCALAGIGPIKDTAAKSKRIAINLVFWYVFISIISVVCEGIRESVGLIFQGVEHQARLGRSVVVTCLSQLHQFLPDA